MLSLMLMLSRSSVRMIVGDVVYVLF